MIARSTAEAVQGAGGVTRVACIRTGLAIEKDGGAFPRILLPFRFGAGGPQRCCRGLEAPTDRPADTLILYGL